MSLFKTTMLKCPSCGKEVAFEAVHSVNADRRPDLRQEILAETFQQKPCPQCGTAFRLDPEFNLLDIARGQWIAAAPLASLGQWKAQEDHARDVFANSYGAEASDMAQEIGRKLKPRITFGWPALREKLVVADEGLDDVTLELCKSAAIRALEGAPLGPESELRLVAVEEEDLIFLWVRTADEAAGQALRVPRELYDDISDDPDEDWSELRQAIEGDQALFIDLNRLLIPSDPRR
jgi:hypothetical protein